MTYWLVCSRLFSTLFSQFVCVCCCSCFFFFKDTATTEFYTYSHTLALHDALPICLSRQPARRLARGARAGHAWRRRYGVAVAEHQVRQGDGSDLVPLYHLRL